MTESPEPRRYDGAVILVVATALLALLTLVGVVRILDDDAAPRDVGAQVPGPADVPLDVPAVRQAKPVAPPRWEGRLFAKNRFFVAYYGTAGTGSLGVLGEDPPARMHQRLLRAAKPFAAPDRPVVPVYELIVTVADAYPGRDGDYSHDIARADVARYARAALAAGAVLLLDIQPGRSPFLDVVKRWGWALKLPHVGLALDPEWRMQRGQVPGQVIGRVGGYEVNQVSAWLSRLVATKRLPEKLFVLHQFRTDMIFAMDAIRPRPGLAMVQHVDGFGTRGQKLDTYRTVASPRQFAMGFKLFYDEDINLFSAAGVLRIRPRVRFVSFQ